MSARIGPSVRNSLPVRKSGLGRQLRECNCRACASVDAVSEGRRAISDQSALFRARQAAAGLHGGHVAVTGEHVRNSKCYRHGPYKLTL
jgi:hypothetical protein